MVETADTATDPKTIPPAVFQKREGGNKLGALREHEPPPRLDRDLDCYQKLITCSFDHSSIKFDYSPFVTFCIMLLKIKQTVKPTLPKT